MVCVVVLVIEQYKMIVMCGGEVPGDLPLLLKGFQSRDKDFKSNSSLFDLGDTQS